MRVLLIYPEFPDTFWSFKHALPFVRKKASMPPLGLLTVAALLPSGWEKRLIDMNVTPLRKRDLQWAEMVFVSAMVAQRDSAHEVVERCHQAGVRVVAGGPLFLGEHEAFPRVDHFVLNEGEVTLPIFLHDLAAGQPKRLYRSELYANMHLSPVPLWELADLHAYSSMPVQYSRGCPFDCDFCNITAMLGRRPRTKSAEQITTELDALYAAGWRDGVFFVDDNFIGKRRELKEEILPALIAWRQGKRGFGFQTEASIDLADDPQLVAQMVEAGFDTVFVGIETPDEESLSECNKRQNAGRDLVECVKTLQRAGLQVQGGFIVGFDHDQPSIFERQVDFIQRSGIVTAMVCLLQAPSGTRLFKRMAAEGRVDGTWTGDNVDGTSNIRPVMDPDVLRRGYQHILRSIYAPRAYYARVR
ncbi:MAG: B12-binding domain-containing radical SAM protein, partial [Chloroflexi bacterium]|nr:B12-binding domain-containing radical SAM protein [Chloroflexota bacterium]